MSGEEDLDDLFGEEGQQQAAGGDAAGEPPGDDDDDLFGDEEEERDDDQGGQRDEGAGEPISIEAPLTALPAADKLHLLNLRNNIISLQPRPFDPAAHEKEEPYYVDEQGNRKPRLFDNVIRWRWQQGGCGGGGGRPGALVSGLPLDTLASLPGAAPGPRAAQPAS
jgi:hypothetical protein